MRGQKSQADLAQASQKVIEMLSELVAQLVIPAVLQHLQTREPKPSSDDVKYVSCDDPMESPSSKRKGRRSSMAAEDIPSPPPCCPPESPKLEEVTEMEPFFELAAQKTTRAVVNNLEKKEGTQTDSHAWKILSSLYTKMKCTEAKKKEGKLRCDSPPCSCFDRRFETFSKGQVKPEESRAEGAVLSPYYCTAITYPLTVSSEQVINEVTCDEFRSASLKALTEFLQTSLVQFELCFGEPPSTLSSVDVTASDLLDTVTSTVTQLALPRPKLFSWPWQKKKCSTVSEEAVSDTARVLKTTLQEKLRKFYYGHKLEEGKMDEAQGAIMGVVGQDKMELLQDGNLRSDDPALIKLEKLISQEQLVLFSNMVTNRVTYMFQEKVQHVHKLQNPNAGPGVDGYPWTTFREELHLFIVDSVKCLLASIAFPPSFWRMDQVIQDNAAAKGKTFDDVVSVCSELVTDQVMEHLSRSSMRKEADG